MGWSPIFLITGLIGLLYGLFYWCSVQEPVSRTPRKFSFSLREIIGDCKRILRNRSTLLIILSLGILYWGRNGICTFLPVYLVDSKGFEFTRAALILWIIPAAGIPGKILGGYLSNWLGRSTFLICAFLASSLGVFLLPLVHYDVVLWGALILFGFFSNAASPLIYAHTTRLYENSFTGMALGTVIGIALLISALSPTVTGVIIDGYGYTIAFLVTGTILGLGTLTL